MEASNVFPGSARDASDQRQRWMELPEEGEPLAVGSGAASFTLDRRSFNRHFASENVLTL